MIKETDEATRMTYLRNLGLLDHPFVQLGRFIRDLFHGDLGRSITVYPKVPISTLMAEKIPVTDSESEEKYNYYSQALINEDGSYNEDKYVCFEKLTRKA